MGRATPPFRADHVGSLLRPPRLLQARDDHAAGRISDEELRAVEDDAIRDVVAMQRDVGLQSATDGEFRRASWHMDFIYRLGGVSRAPEHLRVQFRNPTGTIEFTSAALKIEGKVRLEQTIFGEDFQALQAMVTSATPKLTIPSPNMVHYRGGQAAIDRDVYPDLEQFWSDLGDAYAEQVRRIGELGCTYLQFDDTSLAYLNDPAQRAMVAWRGDDAEHLHLRYIQQINRALAGPAAGDDGHHPYVPRQLPLLLGGRGRLRLRRGGAVRRARGRRLLPGVRRRALGRLRAAALRPQRQAGRPRPGHHPSGASWRTRTCSSGGSRTPATSCRSSSCACRRSAASPPRSRATYSPTTSRSPGSA
jgi:methionine synthase II (cobalamin-independent)